MDAGNVRVMLQIKQMDILLLMFDFVHMLTKIKLLQNVENVFVSLPERDEVIHIYALMDRENLEIEDKIMDIFCRWEMDYNTFPELHILPRDTVENPESYLPEDAISLK